ncbi:MAG: hypothetical protein H0W96_05620, partial [Solirubrobacterales bacterium]|nr:hypothetical protein [Solirubrobacterales bacterium]
TTAREQGTNLARELVERSRQVSYSSTTTSAAPPALAAALPENPTVSGASFTVRRRNINYSVTVTSCSIDDPSDGWGLGTPGNFCDNPLNSKGPGNPATGSGVAVGYTVLGLPVSLSAGGSFLTTVCSAVGTNTAVANEVSELAYSPTTLTGNGAEVLTCPAGIGGTVPYDFTPDDLRRVRVKVDWTQGTSPASSLTQTTLLTTPA